ncbi:hypothetical protein ACFQZC_00620 [Streptacidiphilus monticola]
MTTEPLRPDLRAYLAEQQETAALPTQYRPSVPVVAPPPAVLPADLVVGLLAHERARGQERTALAVQNAQLRAELADHSRMSGRAKDIAVVALGGGIGLGGAAAGIGYGVGAVASASAGLLTATLVMALWAGGATLVMALWAGGATLVMQLLRGVGPLRRAAGGDTFVTHNHVTAKGMFAKAIGGPTRNG